MTPEARARAKDAAVWALVASLGFALGFVYAKNAAVVPIVIEKCDTMKRS